MWHALHVDAVAHAYVTYFCLLTQAMPDAYVARPAIAASNGYHENDMQHVKASAPVNLDDMPQQHATLQHA